MSSSTRPVGSGGGSTGISYGDEGLPDSWMMDYEEVRGGEASFGDFYCILVITQGGSIISAEMAQNERTIHANFFNGNVHTNTYTTTLKTDPSCVTSSLSPLYLDFDDIFNDEDLD